MVYSGQCVGPRNITRDEGQTDITIPCGLNTGQATPFWKISGFLYYPSDVPLPFIASQNGRFISIPVVSLSMNGTSFQCFIPTSFGHGLISSSTGTLTVKRSGRRSKTIVLYFIVWPARPTLSPLHYILVRIMPV